MSSMIWNKSNLKSNKILNSFSFYINFRSASDVSTRTKMKAIQYHIHIQF